MVDKDGFTTHELRNDKGIDDLKGTSAFTGSAQGMSGTNDADAINSNWYTPAFGKGFVYTQANIDAEVAQRQKWNQDYIAKCKSDGSYGQPQRGHTITIKHNPIFDYGARGPRK